MIQLTMREWLLKAGFLGLGLAVLFVSIARAGLDISAQDIAENKLNNKQLDFIIEFGDGVTEPGSYKLPEVNMLPTNMFYGFKTIRDWLWLTLASNQEKPRIALLLADKKITETWDLFNNGSNTAAIDAGNEGLDKLEYAVKLVDQIQVKSDDVRQLQKQIFMAGYAYKQVAEVGTTGFDLDQEKFSQLLFRIDEWNKKQEEARWEWEK